MMLVMPLRASQAKSTEVSVVRCSAAFLGEAFSIEGALYEGLHCSRPGWMRSPALESAMSGNAPFPTSQLHFANFISSSTINTRKTAQGRPLRSCSRYVNSAHPNQRPSLTTPHLGLNRLPSKLSLNACYCDIWSRTARRLCSAAARIERSDFASEPEACTQHSVKPTDESGAKGLI